MFKPLRLIVFAAAAFAQSPADLFHKAPPDVEEALRARVTQFYQFHVEGKFRQAEQLVAEDSKDIYYSSNKPRCLSFQIPRIDYSDNFTRAKATVVCEMIVAMMGFANKPMPVPMPSLWKLVDGQWYWYVDQSTLNDTPFGRMKPGTMEAPQKTELLPKGAELETLLKQVKADKPAVQLKNDAPSSGQVSITNGMPGKIRLSLESPRVAGLEVKLDRAELDAGEKAVVGFRSLPAKQTKPLMVNVRVEPTGQLIPIQVTFSSSK